MVYCTDIRARGFWRREKRAIRLLRHWSNESKFSFNKERAILERNGNEKKRCYNQRIMNIEHGTFTPLVFTMNGFMGVEFTMYHKQLSSKKISEKGDEKY